MTIALNYNHFNKVMYIKYYFVPGLIQNKQCLNYFLRESAKNAFKTLKTQLNT